MSSLKALLSRKEKSSDSKALAAEKKALEAKKLRSEATFAYLSMR
jgi:hypothetical protein